MEKLPPLTGKTQFIRADIASAATTAAVIRALEAAAGNCDAAHAFRNEQRNKTPCIESYQRQRWMAGAMQAHILAYTIRALAADPEQVARIAQDPTP